LAKSIGGCAIRADLTNPLDAVEHIRDGFSKFADHLDVLVNSASIYDGGRLESVTLAQSRRLMAIHFESPMLLAQAFAKTLRASPGTYVTGQIIHLDGGRSIT